VKNKKTDTPGQKARVSVAAWSLLSKVTGDHAFSGMTLTSGAHGLANGFRAYRLRSSYSILERTEYRINMAVSSQNLTKIKRCYL